jgi:LPXTG-site transpeptidase (sortase) family protein
MKETNDENKISFTKLIAENKAYFFINFCIVLLITFSILYLFNLVPPEFQNVVGRAPENDTNIGTGELPISIVIPEVGVNAQVYNPATTSVSVLDDWLLKGAVRWPGSGLLGQKGNVLIFGHSTSYKIVNNQAFKTFVGLKNLKPGDLISVFSGNNEYVYSVLTVEMKEASDVIVNFNTTDSLLTLSTCNTSIGDTSARYVVQAKFVSKKAISQNQ